jgi:uncharacterized membrane protein
MSTLYALGINAALFALLRDKLLTMLTPLGFAHSLALGTGLWATLGWRGWSTCVLYLFLGQAVTKVRFQDKESRGLAEKRGGRRGPENVWCVIPPRFVGSFSRKQAYSIVKLSQRSSPSFPFCSFILCSGARRRRP